MSKNATLQRRRFVTSAVSASVAAAIPARSIASGATQSAVSRREGNDSTTLSPYLLFDGSCAAAMQFYQSVFGGELNITKVSESPSKGQMPASLQERVLNARLQGDGIDISASDWLRPSQTRVRGNSVCLYLSGGTLRHLKTLFERLSAGGEVTDPLKKEFFGAYGALNDNFGVRWMFWTGERGA
jgi:PhnB protein